MKFLLMRLSVRIRIRKAFGLRGRTRRIGNRLLRPLSRFDFFLQSGCVRRERGGALIRSQRIGRSPLPHQRVTHRREQRRIARIPAQRIVTATDCGVRTASLRGRARITGSGSIRRSGQSRLLRQRDENRER